MRGFGILCLLLASAAFLAACDPDIGITVVNNTDEELCWFESGFETPKPSNLEPELCNEVAPRRERTVLTLCTSSQRKWVVVTVGPTGPQIYARSATCGEWEDSGATVTVDEANGEFIVTDSLPDASPTPAGTD